MTFDVAAARAAGYRKLALQTPRAVTLDGDDFALLAGALTLFHAQGDQEATSGSPSAKFDHQSAVERLADRLGVQLGQWTSTEVVAVPKNDSRWRDLDNGSGVVEHLFSFHTDANGDI